MPASEIGAVSTSSLLWQAFVLHKIQKCRDALDDVDLFGPVDQPHHVFRDTIELIFDDFLKLLPRIGATGDADDDRRSRSIATKALDHLLWYLRFYESSLSHRVPAALRDHAQRLFAAIEPRALVLVRPQNSQTFETRLSGSSLHSFIQENFLRLIYGLLEDDDGFRRMAAALNSLPRVYIISYPKFLGTFLPLFPILGHEFGHVLKETRLEDEAWKRLSNLHWLALEADLRHRSADSSTADDSDREAAIAQVAREFFEFWAVEFLCDAIGWHLYGEAFIYALWLMLNEGRSPRSDSLSLDLLAETHEAQLRISTSLRPPTAYTQERWNERYYPHVRTRLRRLISLQSEWDKPLGDHAPCFETWRSFFRAEVDGFVEDFPDERFLSILQHSKALSNDLYQQLAEHLPPAAATLMVEQSEDLRKLITAYRAWVPPVQIVDEKDPSGEDRDDKYSLRPAHSHLVILATWVVFVDAAGTKEQSLQQGWPSFWLDFAYEAFDMAELYRSFHFGQMAFPPSGQRQRTRPI